MEPLAPVAPCPVCGGRTPMDLERCGTCGAQRLVHHDGSYAGHRPLGGVVRRALATGIDVALLLAGVAVALALPDRMSAPGGYTGEDLTLAVVLAWFVYLPVATGGTGRTLGKRLAGLHVVAADGRPVDHRRAAMRDGVARVPEILLAVPLGAASLLSIAFDDRRRALHDRVARTSVVAGPPVPRPPRPAGPYVDAAAG